MERNCSNVPKSASKELGGNGEGDDRSAAFMFFSKSDSSIFSTISWAIEVPLFRYFATRVATSGLDMSQLSSTPTAGK